MLTAADIKTVERRMDEDDQTLVRALYQHADADTRQALMRNLLEIRQAVALLGDGEGVAAMTQLVGAFALGYLAAQAEQARLVVEPVMREECEPQGESK